jgi:alpha-glucosidase
MSSHATVGLQPHHDGSALYLPNPAPALDASFDVLVHVPAAAWCEQIWVRTLWDGEPIHHAAVIDRTDETGTWWRAALVARHNLTPYRFTLVGGAAPYRVLNGVGVHHRDVVDAFDFRVSSAPLPPAWLRDAVVYQIFPDRFARAGGDWEAPAWSVKCAWSDEVEADGSKAVRQVYGGDLDGIVARLDHLTQLGVNVIYLTPFFPAESSHRYNASSFDHVDPLLGGDAALARLTAAAHQRGIRLLADLTTNHTGDTHEWFVRALDDAASDERSFYLFDEGTTETYECWNGYPTLPKLDHQSPALRERLVTGSDSVMAMWLRPPFSIDGWRVDAANTTGRVRTVDICHDVARDMRAATTAIKPDAYLVAEHCYDAGDDLNGDGWHGTMNYNGFTRPVWSWLASGQGASQPMSGTPAPTPRIDGAAAATMMREQMARAPWRSWVASFTLLGSHDTARIASVAASPAEQLVAVGLLMTYPGVPMIFSGDEVGVRGEDGNTCRQPFPWDAASWDHELYGGYRDLIALRRSCDALRNGGLRWLFADGDALVFLREAVGERVLVHAARAAHGVVSIDAVALGATLLEPLLTHDALDGERGVVELTAKSPTLRVWRLRP